MITLFFKIIKHVTFFEISTKYIEPYFVQLINSFVRLVSLLHVGMYSRSVLNTIGIPLHPIERRVIYNCIRAHQSKKVSNVHKTELQYTKYTVGCTFKSDVPKIISKTRPKAALIDKFTRNKF